MLVTSCNNQINIQSLGFFQYRPDCCALDQQRVGIDTPVTQTCREMLQKLMFMAKLGSGLPAQCLAINIKGGWRECGTMWRIHTLLEKALASSRVRSIMGDAIVMVSQLSIATSMFFTGKYSFVNTPVTVPHFTSSITLDHP